MSELIEGLRKVNDALIDAYADSSDLELVGHSRTIYEVIAALSPPAVEPATESYIQRVPDHCDRITWRGAYYHLPVSSQSVPAEPVSDAKFEEMVKQWLAEQDDPDHTATTQQKCVYIARKAAQHVLQAAAGAKVEAVMLGTGLVDVCHDFADGEARLHFYSGGTGLIGGNTEARIRSLADLLAALHFANSESLEVVIAALMEMRAYFEQPQAPSQQLTGEVPHPIHSQCLTVFENWYREHRDQYADFQIGRCYEDEDVFSAHEIWKAGALSITPERLVPVSAEPTPFGYAYQFGADWKFSQGRDLDASIKANYGITTIPVFSTCQLIPVSADAQQVTATALTSEGVEPFCWYNPENFIRTSDRQTATEHAPLYTSPQVTATVPEGMQLVQKDLLEEAHDAVKNCRMNCNHSNSFHFNLCRIEDALNATLCAGYVAESMSSEGGGNV